MGSVKLIVYKFRNVLFFSERAKKKSVSHKVGRRGMFGCVQTKSNQVYIQFVEILSWAIVTPRHPKM